MSFLLFWVKYDCCVSNWNGNYREVILDGVELIRQERGPCPVCGHPTGDCAGDAETLKRIVGLGTIPSMRAKQTVYVDEDVWETVEISTNIFTKILRARKGTHIPFDTAVALGLIEDPNLNNG